MQAELFEDFSRALLQEKGINIPDPEVLDQMVKNTSVRVRDVVLKKLVEDLSADERQRLEKAFDEEDSANADQIVEQHQPVIVATLQQFRRRYLGVS